MTRPRWRLVVAGVAACGYAALASATTPFTVAADAVVAAPLALALASLAGRALDARRATPSSGGLAPGQPDTAARRDVVVTRPSLPWISLVALVAAWEVVSFVALPRRDHPTLSSMYDAVSRWQAVKAILVLGWLALGWALVRR